MTPPDVEKLRAAALDHAKTLLLRRLKRANISTQRPELYVQLEPGQPEPFSGGHAVRVKVWRHWSEARLAQDALMRAPPGAATLEELLAWTIDRRSDPPAEAALDEAGALAAMNGKITLPPGAVLDGVTTVDFARGRKLTQVRWRHEHVGLKVVGDHFTVLVHPTTGKIVGVDQRWTPIA